MADTTAENGNTYLLFRLTLAGETQAAPVTIKAESDDAAVRHAQELASDVGALLCKGSRMIAGWTASEPERA